MTFEAVAITAGTGTNIAVDNITGTRYQRIKLVGGAEGSTEDIQGTAANGMEVDVTRIAAGDNNIGNVDIVSLPAIPAGTNNIGDVDVLTVPADPFGANADAAAVDGSMSAKLRQIATTGIPVTVLPALVAGSANIGDVDVLSLPALPTGDNNIGNIDVLTLPALPAGTNNIGDVDVLSLPALPTGTNSIGTVQPGNTQNTTPWLISDEPRVSGGLTKYHLISAGSTNATVVKNAAGQLYGWYIHNNSAATRKVAFHDSASAPTAGAAIYFSISLAAGAAANVFTDHGIPFASGIGITTVTGMADNDNTAVTANDLNINLFYK